LSIVSTHDAISRPGQAGRHSVKAVFVLLSTRRPYAIVARKKPRRHRASDIRRPKDYLGIAEGDLSIRLWPAGRKT